jgi:hypothetical protein
MKELKIISSNNVSLVDDEDYEFLSQWRWYEHVKGYVYGRIDRKKVFLHRFINKTPNGMMTDHINHNKLDNRKCNLRTCTPAENQQNRPRKQKNLSGYRGVALTPNGKFRAFICVNYKRMALGTFETAEEAAKIYNEHAYVYHGKFAILNK